MVTISCSNVDLLAVTNGFFNCSGNSIGDKCKLTCDSGNYPSSSNETVCEGNGDAKANWTSGIFQCSGKFQRISKFSVCGLDWKAFSMNQILA